MRIGYPVPHRRKHGGFPILEGQIAHRPVIAPDLGNTTWVPERMLGVILSGVHGDLYSAYGSRKEHRYASYAQTWTIAGGV